MAKFRVLQTQLKSYDRKKLGKSRVFPMIAFCGTLAKLEKIPLNLELGVGMASEGIDVRSVGNTLLLNETALIEALNLKFAIEYRAKNMEKAATCLSDMPPRSEEELDPVTLHNQALMNVETNLADSFAKLQYLLTQ
jgi:hypothetical protein